jgi:hypothetical protein
MSPSTSSTELASVSGQSVSEDSRQTGQRGESASKWPGFKVDQPPIKTVGQPGGRTFPVGMGIGATQLLCRVMSLTRAAGNPPIRTVVEAT